MKIEINFDPVEPGQTALGEAPEGFDAIDVSAAFGEGFLFIDADMLVEPDVHQAVVAGATIRADDAGGIDPAANNRSQRGLGAVFNDFGIDLSTSLEDAEDRLLEGASTAQTRQGTAPYPTWSKVAFIDLYNPLKLAALHHSLNCDQKAEPSVK